MPNPQINHSPQRDLTGIARKMLILGLDGATWNVLDPLMQAGRMPHLKLIVEGGTSGVLRSTVPPITPAAWTTFLTGKTPGVHGIIDFERYDVRTNALTFNTTNALRHVRSIWKILGDKGFRVGSVNVPMTYPPIPVNGFLISGFEAVSTKTEFTHPPELKSQILSKWPDYSFKNKWRRKTLGGDWLYAENLVDINKSFHQGDEVLRHCCDEYGWDVAMIVFKMVDNLQHKVWRYIDPRTRSRFPKRCAMAEDCFAQLDVALGRLIDYADQHDAHIFVMSDHGHGSLEGKAQPNLMLRDWGYLKIRDRGAQSRTRTKHSIARLLRKKGKFAAGNFSLTDDLAVDFSRTRAAVMHAGMAGFLYINLKGRQETGIVEPGDYESLRDKLKERFESATCVDPTGREVRIFEQVHKPEKLYGCERGDRDWLPDLMLCPTPRLAVVRKIRGGKPVNWIRLTRMEGTHRPEGIYAIYGKGVPAGQRLDTDIINATPTILAMLGVYVPDDMQGRVVEDIFDPPLIHDTESVEPTDKASDHPPEPVYSADDMAKLTERLADLGYLE